MRKQSTLYVLLVSSLIVTRLATAGNDHPSGNTVNDDSASAKIVADPTPRKPRMWLTMAISKKRETDYVPVRQKLKTSCGIEETEYLFYEVEAFEKMIDHFILLKYKWLNVIIAEVNHKLTLLYQPIDDTDRMGYYTLSDKQPFYLLDKKVALEMINAYRTSCKMRILKEDLDKGDELNYIGEIKQDTLFYNTLSIVHHRAAIKEMIKEIHYQDTENGNKVSGIRAIFSMIGPNGLESGGYAGRYKNRLNVHFEFTKRNLNNIDEIFYIDTTRSTKNPNRTFGSRRDPVILKDEKYMVPNQRVGLDKGQLCPAHCPEEEW